MATIVTRSGKGSPLTHAEVDANFTNLNTDKLELSGGTMTGNLSFGDNDKAIFGAGSDLQIYSDGTTGQIVGDVNITGTLTSDGLTVDGQAVISSSSFDPLYLRRTSAASTTLVMENSDNNGGAFQADSNGLRLYTRTSSSFDERVRLASNGDISFYEDTGTTAKFFWDASTESLGIGTSSPAAELHVYGSTTVARLEGNSTGVYLNFKDTGGDTVFIGAVGDNAYFETNGSERMRIDSSGNVGIGVVPSAWRSSTDAIQFGQSASISSNNNANAVSFTSNSYINSSNNSIYISTGKATNYYQYDGAHVWEYAGSGSAGATVSYSEAMRIDSSGNVGIGTSSPASILHLLGTDPKITLGVSGAAERAFLQYNNATSLLNLDSDGGTTFATNNTEAMRIDSSGNVGINNTSPNTKLDIIGSSTNGSGVVDTLRLRNTGTTLNDGPRLQFTSGTSTSGAAIGSQGKALNSAELVFYAGGNSERARIDSSGNLLVGKTSVGLSGEGSYFQADGAIVGTRDPYLTTDAVFYANRLVDDGNLFNFYKDGTTVGSIGVAQSGDRTYFSGGSYGIASDTSEATIMPCGTTGAGNDGVVDLGKSDARFKDLYLSGGVYLGGTGSANHLDDYEEGTWTATLTNITGGSLVSANYVKVGRLVTVFINFTCTAAPTANSSRFSLPFTPDGPNIFGHGSWSRSTVEGGVLEVQSSNAVCYFAESGSSSGTYIGTATYQTS